MQVPNWRHHSKKDQKRKLKPQALRQAKARLKQFKKRHMGRPKGRPFSVLCVHTDSEITS